MKEIYSYIPENIENGKNFHLDAFLKENNIDRNNPEIAEKIANFEKSLQNQKKLTRDLLLTMLAYYGISAMYRPKSTNTTQEKIIQNVNTEDKKIHNPVKSTTENVAKKPKTATETISQPILQKKTEIKQDLEVRSDNIFEDDVHREFNSTVLYMNKDVIHWKVAPENIPANPKEIVKILNRNAIYSNPETNTVHIHYNNETRKIADKMEKIPHQEGNVRFVFVKEEEQKSGIDVSQQTRLLDEYRQNEWERQKIIAKYGSKEAVINHYNKLNSIIRNSAYDWMWLLTQEIGLSGHQNEQDYYEHQRQVLQKYLDDNPDIKIAVEENDYLLELFGYGFFNRPVSKTGVDGDGKENANQGINYNDGNWHNHPEIAGVQIRRSGNIQEARGNTVRMESSGNGTKQYINSIVID